MAELAADSQVNARIVFWGAEGAGKTTNLRWIHRKLRPDHRGELREIPTRLDPTVGYEMLPIELGEINGVATRIQLIAVPGTPEHAPTRKQLLDQVDGIVLVIDSQSARLDDNLASFEELRGALRAYGRALDQIPVVVQYNKRDLSDSFSREALHRKLDLRGAAAFETLASDGTGVLQCLTTISKRVIRVMRERGGPAAAPSRAAAPAAPPPGSGATELIEREPAGEGPSDVPAPDEEPPTLDRELPAPPGERTLLDESAHPAELDQTVDRTRSIFDESFAEAAALASARVEAPAAADASGLTLADAGRPVLTPDGALSVPLALRDASGREIHVALTIRLDAGEPRGEGDA